MRQLRLRAPQPELGLRQLRAGALGLQLVRVELRLRIRQRLRLRRPGLRPARARRLPGADLRAADDRLHLSGLQLPGAERLSLRVRVRRRLSARVSAIRLPRLRLPRPSTVRRDGASVLSVARRVPSPDDAIFRHAPCAAARVSSRLDGQVTPHQTPMRRADARRIAFTPHRNFVAAMYSASAAAFDTLRLLIVPGSSSLATKSQVVRVN